MFKFTIDLSISQILSINDLLILNSIGFGLILLSVQARLQYLTSTAYHENDLIREMSYPVVVLVNRISFCGLPFMLSILILVVSAFSWASCYYKELFNSSFLLTAFSYLAFFCFYLRYLLWPNRDQLRDRMVIRDILLKTGPKKTSPKKKQK